MREKEDWLASTGTVDAGDDVAVACIRTENNDVARWKACGTQARGHFVRGGSHVADGFGCVGFDQLPEDIVRQLVGICIMLS